MIEKDLSKLQPVPVIASFDSKGNIVPLYIRLGYEQYKIEDFVPLKRETFQQKIILFRCAVIDQGVKKEIELLYMMRETCWYVSEKQTGLR